MLMRALKRVLPPTIALAGIIAFASGCAEDTPGDMALTHNTRVELVDWHIAGLWVINSPVCWFRVYNYNNVPITAITISYVTYDFDGKPLDKGTYTIEGDDATVGPRQVHNYIEKYVGLVSLESDKISTQLVSVKLGEQH